MGHMRVCLLVAAWAISSCASATGAGGSTSNRGRVFTAADHDKQKSVRSGDLFAVSLEASAGSGYRWHLLPPDTTVVRPMGRQTHKPTLEEGPGLVGGTYQEVWQFKALKNGQVDLQFDLYPPWEDRQSAVKTVVLTIVVHP